MQSKRKRTDKERKHIVILGEKGGDHAGYFTPEICLSSFYKPNSIIL